MLLRTKTKRNGPSLGTTTDTIPGNISVLIVLSYPIENYPTGTIHGAQKKIFDRSGMRRGVLFLYSWYLYGITTARNNGTCNNNNNNNSKENEKQDTRNKNKQIKSEAKEKRVECGVWSVECGVLSHAGVHLTSRSERMPVHISALLSIIVHLVDMYDGGNIFETVTIIGKEVYRSFQTSKSALTH